MTLKDGRELRNRCEGLREALRGLLSLKHMRDCRECNYSNEVERAKKLLAGEEIE